MATVDVLPRDPSVEASPLAAEERAVLAAIRELRFGSVEVVVHQSRIVQVVRSEKQRFDG